MDEETRQKLIEQGYNFGDDDEEAEFNDLGYDDDDDDEDDYDKEAIIIYKL